MRQIWPLALACLTTKNERILISYKFFHIKKSISDILSQVNKIERRPLRVATMETAWQDLKHVGRNIEMVNKAQLYEE